MENNNEIKTMEQIEELISKLDSEKSKANYNARGGYDRIEVIAGGS